MTQIAWLAEMAWKGSAVLAVGLATAALLRRASAATFAALVILPAAIVIVPQWSPVQMPAAAAKTTVIRVHGGAAPASAEPVGAWSPWFLAWGAGCLLGGMRFLTGAIRTRSIVRSGRAAVYVDAAIAEITRSAGIRRRVRVVESELAPVPLACGIVRPVIALPREASEWPSARLRTVLLHEATHIARWDVATQAMAHLGCCLYWFHPLAWMAERQLREERERACDDAVIGLGTPAAEYADDLLALARNIVRQRSARLDAPAMAEGSNLEKRIQAMLDPLRNRRPLSARAMVAVGAGLVVLLGPAAAFKAHAQTAVGSLAGVVEDPSGSRVPNCKIVAKNENGPNVETATTNPAGEYRFNAIPAGTYALEFGARGFALGKVTASVAANESVRVDERLQLSSLSESLTVIGKRPPAITPNAAPSSGAIRVGGLVEAAKLVKHADPIYPAELQQMGIQGTVMIQAIVGKDGTVVSARVVNTNIDARLAQQALDAVKQWVYQPARLNKQPVAVTTTVQIEFALD